MNIKLIALASAVAVSAAVAQDDEYTDSAATENTTEETAEAAETPAAPAAPAVEESEEKTEAEAPAAAAAPAAPAQAGLFDVLHSNAYNMVGNEAGASTIGGDFETPYKMAGRKLFYVEPSNEAANLAFNLGGVTGLLAFDNSADQGMVTAGIATPGFGVTVDLALDKQWASSETSTQVGKTETDVSTTYEGDLIRLNAAMPLGALDLKADIFWITFQDETDTEDDNTEEDNDYWDIGLDVNVSNGPSAQYLFWSVGVGILRQDSKTNVTAAGTTTETIHDDAFFEIQPYFNAAVPLLSVENAQLFAGLNTWVPIYFYDEYEEDGAKDDRTAFALYTAPNILVEVSLTENWMIFGGATYNWKLFGYDSEEIKQVGSTTDNSAISMKTYNTSADAGFRFSYKNFVVEASVAESLGSDTWSGLVANLGAFVNF